MTLESPKLGMPDDLTFKALERQGIAEYATQRLRQAVLASTGRENLLQQLKSRYTAPQRLKKKHKDLIKIVKSLEQGYDGTEAICTFCKQRRSINELEVHHATHLLNQNQLHQLQPACKPCNGSENQTVLAQKRLSDPRQGESELGRVALVGNGSVLEDELNSVPFSSREGMKAAIMRPSYDRWVRDLVNGPFSEPYRSFQGRVISSYSWNVRKLAEAAPYGCSLTIGKALGSSKTYLKYIKEDVEGGILVRADDEATSFYGMSVKLNKELLEKIRQESGQ
jgi:hypothetical protein